MEILFFLLLIEITFIAYLTGKRHLLSPWFLLCLVFAAMYFIVLLNTHNWALQINGKFVLYATTAILSFGLGCGVICFFCRVPASAAKVRVSLKNAEVKKKYPTNLFLVLSVALAGIYIMKLLLDAGFSGSIGSTLRGIYENIVNENYSPGFLANQCFEILRAIAYVNTFRFFVKIFSRHDGVSGWKLLIPLLAFLLSVLISTDRNILLRYAFYFICLFVFFFYQNCKGRHANAKIVLIAIAMLAVLVVLFFVYGLMKQYKSNLFRSISIYAGSGLNDFNLWIKDFDEPLSYGKATFSTMLRVLGSIFGVSIEGVENRFDEFISYVAPNGYIYGSNIYSALKPFVQDFGYFGVIIYPFVLGLFFRYIFYRAMKTKYGFSWILYSMIFYPIIFFPIAEQFFARFHLGFVYEIVWLYVIYYFAIRSKSIIKKERKNNKFVQGGSRCQSNQS